MFMIAGPNGAGKSTLYKTRIQPSVKAPFINADLIQKNELKDPSMQASYKAAELAETRRRECLSEGKDFVSESTFSHPSKLELIKDAKDAGFRVVVYHVNLRSPDLSVMRVAQRYGEGGHDVPEDKIRERFARNPALIRAAVLQADKAFVYDNSQLNKAPALAIEFTKGKVARASEQVPSWARELYAKELEPFSQTRLNPESASFVDAKAIAQKIGGSDVVLRISGKGKDQTNVGKIVGETSLHWVQKLEETVFVAHFKNKLDKNIGLQQNYEIKYNERGAAQATRLPDVDVQKPLNLHDQKKRAEQQTIQTTAPRNDLNKNQAAIHDEAQKNISSNIQALQKNPVLAARPTEDLQKLAYWRGVVTEGNKQQPEQTQADALARFDNHAEDPQFLKRLEQATADKGREETAARVPEHKRHGSDEEHSL